MEFSFPVSDTTEFSKKSEINFFFEFPEESFSNFEGKIKGKKCQGNKAFSKNSSDYFFLHLPVISPVRQKSSEFKEFTSFITPGPFNYKIPHL